MLQKIIYTRQLEVVMLINFSAMNALSFLELQQFTMQRSIRVKDCEWAHPEV